VSKTVIVVLLVASLGLTACGDGDEQVIPTSTSPTSTSASTSIPPSTSTSTSVVVESGDAEVCRTAQVFAGTASGQNTRDAAELARVAPRAGNEQLRAAASELGRAGAGWGTGHDAAIETVSTECNDLGIYVQFP
jgi:hypothetical protein